MTISDQDAAPECHCWYVFDTNEGRTGTVRRRPKDDCADCGGSGYTSVDQLQVPGHTYENGTHRYIDENGDGYTEPWPHTWKPLPIHSNQCSLREHRRSPGEAGGSKH